MAAELITPVDEITGLPLLIAPREVDRDDNLTDHHAWHPKRDDRLTPLDRSRRTLAKSALRSSRIQVVQGDLHNEGRSSYHRFYRGPLDDIPEAEEEIFEVCIGACTGVITSQVIDLSTGEPFERPITQQEIEFFSTPSEVDEFGYKYVTYRYEPLRDFFRDYVKRQSLEHIRPALIDEFLSTKDEEKKLKIGRYLLANAVAVATDSVRERYSLMRRTRLIHPAISSSYREPNSLVLYKLGNAEHRDEFIAQDLQPQLAQAG